jgi:DNA-binding response OmpR family regulator
MKGGFEMPQAPKGGLQTILLVESDRQVLKLARRIMERAGFTVITATTAEEALSIESDHTEAIDLLVTSYTLPGLSGSDLGETLGSRLPGLPVILMSGYPDAQMLAVAHGWYFAPKPFAGSVFVDLLRVAASGCQGTLTTTNSTVPKARCVPILGVMDRPSERWVRLPKDPAERRARIRFPLPLEVRYSVSHRGAPVETGSGQIIDLGSSGLRFVGKRPLEPGLKLDVAINWPVLLDRRVQLQLIVTGVVVWSSGTETALRIRRHGFYRCQALGSSAASR